MSAEKKPEGAKPAPELKVVANRPKADGAPAPAPAKAKPAVPGAAKPAAPKVAPKIAPKMAPPPGGPVVDSRVEKAIRASQRAKKRLIIASLAGIVALPTLATAGYYAFIASDQYAAQARFSVRGNERISGDMLSVLTGGGAGANVGDSYILQEYIGSRELVDRLQQRVDLESRYATPAADFLTRFSAGDPVEDFVEYWRGMVSAEFDHYTGIITLEVKAFTAEDARLIASAVVEESRSLVNRLSEQSRQDTVSLAQREVQFAEDRLREARGAVAEFRNEQNTVSPVAIAQAHEQLIGQLEGQLVQAEAELSQIASMVGPEAPSRRILESRIAAIRDQIAERKTRVSSGGSAAEGGEGISSQLATFESLETEAEFAQKHYLSALTSLEAARVEAKRDQRYLATFVTPSLPQEALYPLRVTNTVLIFAGSLVVWGISALLYAAIRDHMV